MNKRIDEFWKTISNDVEASNRVLDDKLVNYYNEKREDLIENFTKCIDESFQKNNIYEENGEQREIKYIVVSILNSSFYTKKYDLLIELCSKDYLSDIKDTSSYFSYDFMIPWFEEELNTLTKRISENFIRVMNYELESIRSKYKYSLYLYVLKLIIFLLNEQIIKQHMHSLIQNINIDISIGYYLNNQKIISHLF